MQFLIFWACDINCKSPLRLCANGHNIVGCYMLCPFAHPVAFCWMLLCVVTQSLKPVKLFSQQLPPFLLFGDRRSVAQQCWIRLHSSSNIVGATHAHYAWFTKTYILPSMHCRSEHYGEQGWCSGESTCLPLMWPGFESWRWRHMWVEFVVGSLPSSERFFSGYSGFPLSLKTNTFKFQFNLERTDTFQQVLMHSLVLRG